MRLRYLEFTPDLATPFDLAPMSAVAGRTTAGAGLVVRPFATLRADGAPVRVGRNVFFSERATVHIAHDTLPAIVGDDVTVGRFGLVHACTLGAGRGGRRWCDGDGRRGGRWIRAGRARRAGAAASAPRGRLHEGNPATPTREVARDEVEAAAHAIRGGVPHTLATFDDLPPLDMAPFVAEGPFRVYCTRCTATHRAWRVHSSRRPPWSSATWRWRTTPASTSAARSPQAAHGSSSASAAMCRTTRSSPPMRSVATS